MEKCRTLVKRHIQTITLILLSFLLLNGCSSEDINGTLVGSPSTDPAPLVCPTNYVKIPALAPYTAEEFCVMKYEAKLEYQSSIVADGNLSNALDYDTDYETQTERDKYKAVSDITGQPWSRMKRGETVTSGASGQGALEACQALGAGYDLVTNDQWQAIARDIEATTSNWSADSFGDVMLNHGHADNDPGQSCDASNEYIDTDCANTGSETDSEEKRTHNLSNGEVIWDIAGNVWEWVKDDNTAFVYKGAFQFDYWTEADVVTYPNIQAQFGPASLTCANPTTNNYCGLGYIYDGSGGAVLRGGRWSGGTVSGVFVASLNDGPSFANSFIGFRCAFVPQ